MVVIVTVPPDPVPETLSWGLWLGIAANRPWTIGGPGYPDRNGTFYLDTNNNHQLDATDNVFQLGSPGDKPVAGDWTGNGVDKVGVYHDGGAAAPHTASAGGAAAVK